MEAYCTDVIQMAQQGELTAFQFVVPYLKLIVSHFSEILVSSVCKLDQKKLSMLNSRRLRLKSVTSKAPTRQF